MARVISNYLGNLMLTNTLCRYGGWLALCTDGPGLTNATANAAELGGTTRQRVLFAAASGKGVVSTNKQLFTEVPAATLTYMALWDAQISGNYLVPWSLNPDLHVTAMGQVLCAVGDLAVLL